MICNSPMSFSITTGILRSVLSSVLALIFLISVSFVSSQTQVGQNALAIVGPGSGAILTVINNVGTKIFEVTNDQVYVFGNLDVTGGMKVTGGASIAQGALNVNDGGVIVQAGGASVTSGRVNVNNGGIDVTTGLTVYNSGASFPSGLGTVSNTGFNVQTQMTVSGSFVLTSSAIEGPTSACSGGLKFVCLLSDQRLKFDVMAMRPNEALRQIMATRPVSYMWREDAPFGLSEDRRTQVGFIAQELEEALDHEGASIVHRTASPSGGEILTVDYGRLTALLAGAVQAQQELIEELM